MRHIRNRGSFGNEGETGCWMRTGKGLGGNGVFFLFFLQCLFLSSLTLFFLNVFPFSCFTSSCINFTCLVFCVRQLRQRTGRYWRMATEGGNRTKKAGEDGKGYFFTNFMHGEERREDGRTDGGCGPRRRCIYKQQWNIQVGGVGDVGTTYL
ncbi:uncharacterized protein B0T23DRAFT_204216 [Neurospora hispaniola]|uniref:Uncharacterized protein n=1 Tax=Neurospora hispaniola TaxID=588809 RepID=A0AAJ0I504_9PEZI|nr:hypothetical protein B0T23DRAFT_204216 [Neurospora hispaniola]